MGDVNEMEVNIPSMILGSFFVRGLRDKQEDCFSNIVLGGGNSVGFS